MPDDRAYLDAARSEAWRATLARETAERERRQRVADLRLDERIYHASVDADVAVYLGPDAARAAARDIRRLITIRQAVLRGIL